MISIVFIGVLLVTLCIIGYQVASDVRKGEVRCIFKAKRNA